MTPAPPSTATHHVAAELSHLGVEPCIGRRPAPIGGALQVAHQYERVAVERSGERPHVADVIASTLAPVVAINRHGVALATWPSGLCHRLQSLLRVAYSDAKATRKRALEEVDCKEGDIVARQVKRVIRRTSQSTASGAALGAAQPTAAAVCSRFSRAAGITLAAGRPRPQRSLRRGTC